MKLLRSLVMAFSMYSKLPMPRIDWREENMAYAMCFFPLVGVLVGGLMLLWRAAAAALGIGTVLAAAVFALIPLAVTGGIHMDGFCDTVDALASHAPRERKLAILKDSSAGAFAVIAAGAYLMLYFALWSEVSLASGDVFVLALVPVLARGLSALSVVTFRGARTDGLLAAFRDAADVRVVRVAAIVWIAAAAGAMAYLSPLAGGAAVLAAGLSFLHYRLMSYRVFGGATGDIAGYFLQICELACLAAAVLAGRIGG